MTRCVMVVEPPMADEAPNPGSREAVVAGCWCAVLDNNHGRFPPHPDGHWWVTEGCPLHDKSKPS